MTAAPQPPSLEQQHLAQLVFGPEAVKAALAATEGAAPRTSTLSQLSAASVAGVVVCVVLLVAAVVAGAFIAHRRGASGGSGWPVAVVNGIVVLALGIVVAALASGAIS